MKKKLNTILRLISFALICIGAGVAILGFSFLATGLINEKYVWVPLTGIGVFALGLGFYFEVLLSALKEEIRAAKMVPKFTIDGEKKT